MPISAQDFHLAIQRGQRGIVTAYCKEEGNLEAEDDFGNTAIILAAEYNRYDIAKELIDAGANIHAENAFGRSATAWAEEYNSNKMKAILNSTQHKSQSFFR